MAGQHLGTPRSIASSDGAPQLIDPYWTIIPVLIAHFYHAHPTAQYDPMRARVVLALVWIWSIRLTHSYFRREEWKLGAREDWRFADMRKDYGKHWWWISFLCAPSICCTCTPAHIASYVLAQCVLHLAARDACWHHAPILRGVLLRRPLHQQRLAHRRCCTWLHRSCLLRRYSGTSIDTLHTNTP